MGKEEGEEDVDGREGGDREGQGPQPMADKLWNPETSVAGLKASCNVNFDAIAKNVKVCVYTVHLAKYVCAIVLRMLCSNCSCFIVLAIWTSYVFLPMFFCRI